MEGLSCIGYSEIDKYAIQIYEKHFKHKNYGDATTINAAELPDFDLLVGGFPCQAFSIAGKRLGLEDSRGTLFYDIARIAKEKRPQHLLLENVKGLLSHDNGRTFKLIISTFAELGYNLEWQVLNSKNHGVPQNRERVFIIGHSGRCCGRQVFPLEQSSGGNLKYSGGVISSRQKWLEDGNTFSRNFSQGQRIYSTDGISQTLAGNAGGQGGKTGLYETEEMRIRRLTPIECERLQGYPDGWTELGLSDIISLETLLTKQLCQNVKLSNAKNLSSSGVNNFALNIISDGENGGIQISSTPSRKKILENVKCVIDLLMLEDGVCDTTNLGNDMATLYSLNGTSLIEETIKENLILEKMAEKSISQLWKILLDGNLPKEKLFIISTWIKEIIKSQIFTCVKTEEPIMDAIIVYKKLELNSLKGESLSLKMGNTISISDTQRYKTLGNSVTVNVIEDIIKRLYY